jgi:hypothetical protein
MSVRFVANSPSIPKQFQSGQILGGTRKIPNTEDIVSNFDNSVFSANIQGSNTFYPFFANKGISTENDPTSLDAFDILTSNAMILTDNYNVIRVDLHNKGSVPVKVSAFYSVVSDLREADIKYSTIIGAGEVFYRNYPVQNKFFNMALTPIGQDTSAFSVVNGSLSFTKFTEYNTPSQLSDPINRFAMSNISRDGNSFTDDVLVDRFSDVKKTSRLGLIDSILNEKQNVWNFNGSQDFSSLVNTACVIRSDNILDNGLKVNVVGWSEDTPTKLEGEIVELFGTSNVGMLTEFKMISDMRIIGSEQSTKFNNEGTIEIYRFGTNELMAQMKSLKGRMTSFQYICPPNYRSVVKQVQINGNTGYNLESKLNLYRVEGVTGTRQLVYQNNQFDAHINGEVNIDIGLSALDILYAEVESSNIGLPTMGDSQYQVRANIFEYPTSLNTLT